MGYRVTAGYVTVPTAVEGGRAHIDIPRGAELPGDVPAEDVERLLALGHIEEPDGPGVDTDGDGVPEGSAKQVMAWVGEDRERAISAYNAELDKGDEARKTLLGALKRLVDEQAEQ